MVSSAVLIYERASTIREIEEHAFNVRVPGITTCKELQRDLNQTGSKARQAILAGGDQATRAGAKKAFDEAWENIEEQEEATLDTLAPKWTLQDNRDRYTMLKKLLPAFREADESAMKH